MSTQISIKLSDQIIKSARKHVREYGYDSLQDLIRELLRRQLYEVKSINTMIASEKNLAKHWNTKTEDRAWKHLQKEK